MADLSQLTPPQILRTVFGFETYRTGQEAVISQLLAGHSALAVFPTGGGKSLCYQLPALCLPGLTLVVSPLLALMKDQVDFLLSKGVAAARLDSSLDAEQYNQVLNQLGQRSLKLLYVSPERCTNQNFRTLIAHHRISLLAVDEAHCISQWGPNFRPDYLQIAQFARDVRVERTLALTATATPQVVEDIAANFGISPDHITNTGIYRPNLTLRFIPVENRARDASLFESDFSGPTIVYVTQRSTAEQIANRLAVRGIPARPYHAGMNTEEREEIQNWFLASEQATVVATIAFGMGIDKSNIRAVYHFNLPKGIEGYIQEIGRAGRDGKPSLCQSFLSADDVPVLANFAYGSTPTREAIEGVVTEIFSGSTELELNLYDLSRRFDIREPTLKTLLAHLQLDGYLKSRMPVYLLYEFQLQHSVEKTVQLVAPEMSERVRKFIAHASKGITWYKIDFGGIHKHLEPHRHRAEEILNHLKERNLAVVKNSGVRHRFSVLQTPNKLGALVKASWERFTAQERMEIERLEEMLRLVQSDECHWNALARYFGEVRTTACGHCSFCELKKAITLKPRSVSNTVPVQTIRQTFQLDPEVFEHPRVLARFLCGISSPRLTQRKLTKHENFGLFSEFDFHKVLAHCESVVGAAVR